MAKLNRKLGESPTQWCEVDLGDDGKFEIEITSPKAGDRISDQTYLTMGHYDGAAEEASRKSIEHRFQTVFTNWRDINDGDDKPIPFSQRNLMALCDSYPKVFPQLTALVAKAFREDKMLGELLKEEQKKSSTDEE